MKFEYKQLKYDTEVSFFSGTDFNNDQMTDDLNKLGQDGWDLVNTYTVEKVKGGTKFIICILKRHVHS